MIVYRITLAKYARALFASGNPARWNSRDVKMIYTAESKALACLENVVHRNSKGLQAHFKVMYIEIPDDLQITVLKEADLKKGWSLFKNMPYTQEKGNQWIKEKATAILQVPSVIIKGTSNFLLNPAHNDFSNISLLKSEVFTFDSRIKGR
jgi:RES domain-containing protein